MTSSNHAQPAATLMLIRDSADGVEVFMITRHHRIDAFTGALVFPGGKVDMADRATPIIDYCRGGAESSFDLPFRVAAIREAFEEAGLLFAYPQAGADLLTHDQVLALSRYRQGLRDHSIGVAQFCREAKLQLATDRLYRFAHWITPVTQPKRFDTHFYLALAPEQAPSIDNQDTEVHNALWISPLKAIAEAEQGLRVLVFPTRMNLLKLARSTTAADAIATARSEPVVTVQPEITPHPDGTVMTIPSMAGYGASRLLVSRDARTVTMLS
ncbi:MAG: NUDIX domain-containing protein [Gammaproteobacteria bacterium]